MDTTADSRLLIRQPSRADLRPLWLAGALLMMLDGLSTWWALTSFPGQAHEGNPIGVWAFEHIGIGWACFMKGVIGVTMVWRLAARAERGNKWEWMNRTILLKKSSPERVKRNARRVLIATVVLMSLVVLNNFLVILVKGVG